MKEILFLISLAAFVFCFIYFLAGKITRIKTKGNKKKSFDFKNLTVCAVGQSLQNTINTAKTRI